MNLFMIFFRGFVSPLDGVVSRSDIHPAKRVQFSSQGPENLRILIERVELALHCTLLLTQRFHLF